MGRRGGRRGFLQQVGAATGALAVGGPVPLLSSGAARQGSAAADHDVFERCDRWLSEHGPVRPRDVLTALANATSAETRRDLYGRGELIESFERDIASLLGKEAAVFVISGTMAQQIAFRIHAERRGRRVVGVHALSHPALYELNACEVLHGLRLRLLGSPERLLSAADLSAYDRVAEPLAVLSLELPQRELGGQLPSWDELQAQATWARQRGAAVHMDGARLWESAPFYGRSYADIAALFDTVYVSLYKGIGGLAGCCVAGPQDVIGEMRTWRLRHGGRLVHQFPYVLAAQQGLRRRLGRFPHYCARARALAAVFTAAGLEVLPDPPHAHMMHVYLRGSYGQLLECSRQVAERDGVLLFTDLRPTPQPHRWRLEVQVGDGLDAISDTEVRRFAARLAEVGARV